MDSSTNAMVNTLLNITKLTNKLAHQAGILTLFTPLKTDDTTLIIGVSKDSNERLKTKFVILGKNAEKNFDDWFRRTEDIQDTFSLDVKLRNDTILITTIIRDSIGQIIARIKNNEWRINPYTFNEMDRNYDSRGFEIVDNTGNVLFQASLFKGMIFVNGIFFGKSGYGWVLANGENGQGFSFIPIKRDDINKDKVASIKPIFRYPSELFLGLRVKPLHD